jgi:fructose-1-phosphate kinase PfkB-like protein
VALVSPVGSGEAGQHRVAAATLQGARLDDALRLGVACGAANTMTIGAGVVRPDDVARIRAAITLLRYT